MDVQVKLWMQGGHAWEFCCDEDDPIIFGLVSALPGADLGGNLPQDGLIQVETRTGERVFLARSSLVSVDVVPIVDELQFLTARRLTAAPPKPTQGLSTPSPFVMASDALPSEVHRALLGHALEQDALSSTSPQNGPCDLKLGPLEEVIVKEFRPHVYESFGALGLTQLLDFELRLGLFPIGDGDAISWEAKRGDVLCAVYHCYKQPRGFAGGGVRLFDCTIENGVRHGAAGFRDVDIDDNSALIFPSDAVCAGLPVRSEVSGLNERLYVLLCSARQGAHE
jgi:hypothetical protein